MSLISDMWAQIQLESALTAMVEGVTGQVTSLLPIGLGIMFALSMPKILKRVVGTFI